MPALRLIFPVSIEPRRGRGRFALFSHFERKFRLFRHPV